MIGKILTTALVTSAVLTSGLARSEPIPAEALAKVPDIQSVSMSADGEQLVAIIALPGSDNRKTALATWT